MGPLSPYFHQVAGDRLVEKLRVEDKTFPEALDREWRNYVNAFAAQHGLEGEKLDRIYKIFDEKVKRRR